LKDDYDSNDRFENISNRRILNNKIFSSTDLNSKQNSKFLSTQNTKPRFTYEEQVNINTINEFLTNNYDKLNKIYVKKKNNEYKKINNEEQFDLDLREFINNKIKKNNKKTIYAAHQRSNSTNLFNY
jgi:hypothetical protein